MNKYQEALETIDTTWFPIDLIQSGKMTKEEVELMEYYREAYKLLQELVDRATPKKPIVKIANGVRHIDCPSCDDGYAHNLIENKELNDNYCANCGQALDWTNESEQIAKGETNEK